MDALCDGHEVVIGGIMQHVEEAGVHSGDSACVIPAMSLGPEMLARVEEATQRLALRLGVVGLINIQFAVHGDDDLYVIEANPRASRTVPFVSKATGVPLAKLATRVLLGERLADMREELAESDHEHVSVKEAVLPFGRFPSADSLLGPEMKSTGEVMGIAKTSRRRSARRRRARARGCPRAARSSSRSPTATRRPPPDRGRAARPRLRDPRHRRHGAVDPPHGRAGRDDPKIGEGSPNVVDRIEAGDVDLVINTPTGSGARSDGYEIRSAAVARGIPCITTMTGAARPQRAILALRTGEPTVRSLQELHPARGEAARA